MIDPRAIVSPEAELADGRRGRCRTPSSAPASRSAPGRWIGPHAVIKGPTTIGRDNQVFQFASIGDAPQDKKYEGEPTRLEIGDRNMFREFCTINRGTTHGGGESRRIGSDNLFMAYSHVAHDCIVGNHCVMANYATLGGHVELGDWVIMARLLRHPPVLQGRRARLPRQQRRGDARRAAVRDGRGLARRAAQGINSEGLKRRGFTPEQIREHQATPTACCTARS